MPEVAFIGAGSMGMPMVERLLDGGVSVRVFARSESSRQHLAARGATVADSNAEVVVGLGLCVLCLFSGDQVEQVALGADGVLANMDSGGVLVVHTTVTPETLKRLSTSAAERGVTVVDAPISGTSEAVRIGELTVLFGGEAGAVERCSAVTATYSATAIHVGDVGAATTLKLLNNLTFAAHAQVAESVVRLAETLGIESADLVAALGACSGDSVVFSHMRTSGTDILAKSAPYLKKDFAAVDEVVAGAGGDLGLLREIVARGPLDLTD